MIAITNRQEKFILRKKTLEVLGETRVKFLIEFINKGYRYNYVCPSQAHMGRVVGVSREWANKNIKILREIDLVKSTYRFKRTCRYELPSWLYKEWVLPFLRNLLWIYQYSKTRCQTSQFTLLDLIRRIYQKNRDRTVANHYRWESYNHRDHDGRWDEACELCQSQGRVGNVSFKSSLSWSPDQYEDEKVIKHTKERDRVMNPLLEVDGLSPSDIEALTQEFSEDVLRRAVNKIKDKKGIFNPAKYLRTVCLSDKGSLNRKTDSSTALPEVFVPAARREDLQTGAIRMQAFRVTPMYKRAEALGFSPLSVGLACIWQDIPVDPSQVSAMIALELEYHKDGSKLCPLSMELATNVNPECPFYELSKENLEVHP